jgi:hypothetical protein
MPTERLSGKQHRRTPFTRRDAAILLALAGLFVVAPIIMTMMRNDRFFQTQNRWRSSIAWDRTWPDLPPSTSRTRLRPGIARAIYAFAGKEADVLEHIPCYCGCVTQGHRSNADCYVKHRSVDARVTEWNDHGLTCPLGPDITGDVMLWREQSRPMATIRRDIENEYSRRGPATPTPWPEGEPK